MHTREPWHVTPAPGSGAAGHGVDPRSGGVSARSHGPVARRPSSTTSSRAWSAMAPRWRSSARARSSLRTATSPWTGARAASSRGSLSPSTSTSASESGTRCAGPGSGVCGVHRGRGWPTCHGSCACVSGLRWDPAVELGVAKACTRGVGGVLGARPAPCRGPRHPRGRRRLLLQVRTRRAEQGGLSGGLRWATPEPVGVAAW